MASEGKEAAATGTEEKGTIDGLRVRAAKKEFHTFKYSVKFYASPNAVFDAFTDPRDVMRYTGAPATGKAEEGADWTIMEGAIGGTYATLSRGESIVTSWRFKDWAEGDASTVTITLTPDGEDACTVELVQTGIPGTNKYGHSNVLETVSSGWGNFIFGGIKQRLGFGMDVLA